MLKPAQRLKPLTLVALLIAILTAPFLGATPALAEGEFGCDGPTCTAVITDPGSGGGGNTGGNTGGDASSDEGSTDFTPGPKTCTHKGKTIPCTRGDGGSAWDNSQGCYWELMDPQRDPPAGASDTGAWYSCTPLNCGSGGGCKSKTQWFNSPPPGITKLSPAQAARRLVDTFTLEGLDIGMAPKIREDLGHRRSYVGVPIWLWPNSKTATNWGPYEKTATLGGQTITATAKVSSIQWNMGDGNTVSCGDGTPYSPGFGYAQSPNCGHKYTKTSANQPGGKYPITVTSNWVVTWTGGGQSGEIDLTTTSSTEVEILELQSVNVPNPDGTSEGP
ncbi:hypothetical protein [Pseudoclavibacter albus]|uniref:hypothetical protein n=1 Tax=Pseudoclavibacter albus TaxID=272241 RepID=UPI001F154FEE|nr:hypothetical protein [Pseudoclavibacter alba]